MTDQAPALAEPLPEQQAGSPVASPAPQPAATDAAADGPADLAAPAEPAAGPSSSVLVFEPAGTSAAPPAAAAAAAGAVDDAFFEPTLADVQAHHASVLARSTRLNNAPLLTAKHREGEARERERRKRDKWPTTTVRVKFPDGTQIQSTFPSDSPIQPVYAFVRDALAPSASTCPFTLYQPPRTLYPEHPPDAPRKKPVPGSRAHVIPPANYGAVRGQPVRGLEGGTGGAETLFELGLVPQSLLLVRWAEEGMNASTYPAPIKDELKAKSVPLPPVGPPAAAAKPAGASAGGPAAGADTGERKIPKWLAKGLMKKK